MSAPIEDRHRSLADQALGTPDAVRMLAVAQALADQEATTRKEVEAETVERVAAAITSQAPHAWVRSRGLLAEWLLGGAWKDVPR